MPKSVTKYKILIASPSDVQDERESINEVINELNNTYGSRSDVILEIIKWETHSAPAASESDIQNQIDKDLGADYDLFIGILWKRFGTPTSKYESGTEQEFVNAFKKFKNDPNSIQILFYFKTSAPTKLSEIEPLELGKVNKFRHDLGNKSILYWDFNTSEELQKFLRIHIPKRIDELKKSSQNNESKKILTDQESNDTNEEEDELGILDFQEIVDESFNDSTRALNNITEATIWVGNEIRKKTAEINILASKDQDISKKNQRDIYRRTAEIMNDYANRLEPEIPIFSNNFGKGIDAFSNLINLYRIDLGEKHEENIKTAIETIVGLVNGLKEGIISTKSFLDSVSKLPRMEKQLNRARRNVEIMLKELISKYEVSYSIADELCKDLTA